MSINNGMTPQQALNYLESLGVVISNGRAHHDINSVKAAAVLRQFVPIEEEEKKMPMQPSEEGPGA